MLFYVDKDILESLDNIVPANEDPIIAEENIEYYECQKCGEFNIVKTTPRKRRAKRVRHLRLDDVVYASLRKFATINNVDLNYCLLLLLHNARSKNISYLVNEKSLVQKTLKKNDVAKGKHLY